MVIRSRTLATASSALLLGGLLAGGVRSAAAPAPATAMLTLDPQAALKTVPMYLPTPITLAAAKPGSVKKEPAYRAVPKYGSIKLGNDPSGTYVIAVDEPADADWKIYLDANRNGDLTDDGDGAWASKKEGNGRTQYGPSRLILDAAWTLADGKKSAAKYGISMYRFSNSPVVFMYGEGVRTGTITLDGKPHKMALLETAYDAVYSKPAVASIEESKKARAIWLVVDLDDNGKFDYQGAERVDPRAPFKLGDTTYEATIVADGSSITLTPSTRVALDLIPRPMPRPPLLAEGTPAPDFSVEAWNGGTLSLSKYRGQVVILDFWSTWCGPCQRSMPHVEKVYQAVKDQKVAVLAVCVWDKKDAYSKWMPENKDKYHFTFGFDPKGSEDNTKSFASTDYKVSGIPTTYVIDKEGKVAAAIVGYQDGDKRIEEALKKLGIKLNELASAK